MAMPHGVDTGADELSGTIGGRYRVVRRLGAGGMGCVYEVDDGFGRRALKTLRREFAALRDMRQRFDQEIAVLTLIHHDCVARILDAGFDEAHGLPYLVMDLLEGTDLEAFIASSHGRVEKSLVVRLVSQIATALDAIHDEGVVHRDLKPANVFIEHRRGHGLAEIKLLDFGIAKLLETGSGRTTLILGTPQYMAPEQWNGNGIDERTDIYALGQLVRAMLFGPQSVLPANFANRPPEQQGPIGSWLAQATAFEKETRFQRASLAALALKQALGVTEALSPYIRWEELDERGGQQPTKPRASRAWLWVLVALLLPAGGGLLMLRAANESRQERAERQAYADSLSRIGEPMQPAGCPTERREDLSALTLAARALAPGAEGPAATTRALAAVAGGSVLHWRLLARAQTALGRFPDALRAAESAVQTCASDAAARHALGSALQRLSRDDDAAAAYREALALDPTRDASRFNLGLVWLKKGQPQPALALFAEIARHNPAHPRLDFVVARAHLLAGDNTAAIASVEQAIQRDPTDAEAFVLLAKLQNQQGMSGKRAYCQARALGVSDSDVLAGCPEP